MALKTKKHKYHAELNAPIWSKSASGLDSVNLLPENKNHMVYVEGSTNHQNMPDCS